jgi:toxin ParE1/3/4
MPDNYTLSNKADNEVKEIFKYSYVTFGENQAHIYINGLENCFENLVENPHLGRSCHSIRAGYFRFEYISHIIFYTLEPDTVLISRVIHKSMDIKAQLREEAEHDDR